MQTRMPTTTEMIMVSRDFLRWMPSISRPNPGTFAAETETEAEAGCLSEQPISHRGVSGVPVRLERPPEDPVSELRCPARALFVSNAWLWWAQ